MQHIVGYVLMDLQEIPLVYVDLVVPAASHAMIHKTVQHAFLVQQGSIYQPH